MNSPIEASYTEPNALQRLAAWFSTKFKKKRPTNTHLHALREFKALGYAPVDNCDDDPNKWIQQNVLELLDVFSNQGHSGFSAPYCIDLFKKLASYEPLCALTGADDEWHDVSEPTGRPMWQNIRCSRVFKDGEGNAYDIEGRIFKLPDGACYTSKDSRVYVAFPYTPFSVYVDVDD